MNIQQIFYNLQTFQMYVLEHFQQLHFDHEAVLLQNFQYLLFCPCLAINHMEVLPLTFPYPLKQTHLYLMQQHELLETLSNQLLIQPLVWQSLPHILEVLLDLNSCLLFWFLILVKLY